MYAVLLRDKFGCSVKRKDIWPKNKKQMKKNKKRKKENEMGRKKMEQTEISIVF